MVVTELRRYEREDGIFNLKSPSTSTSRTAMPLTLMAAIDGQVYLNVYRELGAYTLSAT